MRGIVASIRERLPNHIDMVIPVEAGVSQYRIRAANTLDTAWTGTTDVVFTVSSKEFFQSPSVKTRKHHAPHGAGRDRAVTRAIFDPMDYYDPSTAATDVIPQDDDILFMRIERFLDTLGTWETAGPINVILPAAAMRVGRPILTLYGTAPQVGVAGSKPTATAMHLHLPQYTAEMKIINLDAANDLLVAFGTGQTFAVVPAGGDIRLSSANATEILLGADTGAVLFSAFLTLMNGP
jgi:hypothetical protein